MSKNSHTRINDYVLHFNGYGLVHVKRRAVLWAKRVEQTKHKYFLKKGLKMAMIMSVKTRFNSHLPNFGDLRRTVGLTFVCVC